jgi:glycosyltransferase involved in cell wall biosynthesis
LAGIPVVGTLHSTHARPTGRLYHLRFLAEQYLLRFCASHVIAVGRMIEEVNRNRLAEKKMDVVSNPVQPLPFLSQEERKMIRQGIAVDSNRFLILTVGRLQPEKGLQDLLIAFSRVLKKYSSAMLILVGNGEILDELKLQAASLGLDGNVRFMGLRHDVPQLMMAGDVYVSSSYREGLSLAMLEAMSAGLPILATKVGDTEFLLNEDRGLMVAPRDVIALADGMCYLIENPKKMNAMGHAAREFVKSNYSPSSWMDKLIAIYEQV